MTPDIRCKISVLRAMDLPPPMKSPIQLSPDGAHIPISPMRWQLTISNCGKPPVYGRPEIRPPGAVVVASGLDIIDNLDDLLNNRVFRRVLEHQLVDCHGGGVFRQKALTVK